MYVCANFGDSRLKPEMSCSAHFRTSITSDQKSIVTSYPVWLYVDLMGVRVRVKFGDSRSNRSRDVRLPHFDTNDDYNDDADRRTLTAFCIKPTNYETE